MEDRECRDAFHEISQLANIAKGLSNDEQLEYARDILEWAERILELVGPRDTSQVVEAAPDADANALFDLMELEADDVAVYWGGDGFRRQAQKILTLAEAAEQRLPPDEHVVVLVDETSDPEAITQPTDYPRAGHESNSAGTSSMPEIRHRESEVLQQEQRNKLRDSLLNILMHRQRVEECCRAYRNGRSVCLRSHELQLGEPSMILLCCLCGGQRPSNFCMSCAECRWDACGQCIAYLRANVARLEEHALKLQKAEDGLAVGLLPCFHYEKPLSFASFTAVVAALEPSHQKLAICLESIQVMQILHKMPLPNARHSQTLKEAASEMRNRQNTYMLLKVSDSLAHSATSPRCRHVLIRLLLCVACAARVLFVEQGFFLVGRISDRPTNQLGPLKPSRALFLSFFLSSSLYEYFDSLLILFSCECVSDFVGSFSNHRENLSSVPIPNPGCPFDVMVWILSWFSLLAVMQACRASDLPPRAGPDQSGQRRDSSLSLLNMFKGSFKFLLVLSILYESERLV